MIALVNNCPLFIRKAVKGQDKPVFAINEKTREVYFAINTTMYVNGKKRAAIRYENSGKKAVAEKGYYTYCETCKHLKPCMENHWALTYDKDGVTCDHFEKETDGE